MDEYRGKEIISELIVNPPWWKSAGKIKKSQKILVKCSKCDTIKSVTYSGHVFNRQNSKSPTYKCRSCISGEQLTKYNLDVKGLTLEERLGDEKAKKLRNFRREYALENTIIDRLPSFTGKTWEMVRGKEKADRDKEFLRNNHHLPVKYGKDNPQWGKPAHKLSGKGTKGYYNGIYFRSLMEASFIINFLERQNLTFENGEKKKYAIPYMLGDVPRNYFCDFVVDNTFYEVKPKALHNTIQNKAKWEYAKKWCGERGYTFKVYSEYDFDLLKQYEIDNLIDCAKLVLI
jgi:hypothetical protein